MTLLAVDNLTVTFPTADGIVHAVRGLSFSVDAGKTLGVVGESGSGKSVSALTLLAQSGGRHDRFRGIQRERPADHVAAPTPQDPRR